MEQIISDITKVLHATVLRFSPCPDSPRVVKHSVRVLAEQELCIVEVPVTLDGGRLFLVVLHYIPDCHPRALC